MKRLSWFVLAVALVATTVGCTEEPDCFDHAQVELKMLRGEDISDHPYLLNAIYERGLFTPEPKLYRTASSITNIEQCVAQFKEGTAVGLETLGTSSEELRLFKKQALLKAMERLHNEEGPHQYVANVADFTQAIMVGVLGLTYEDMGWSKQDFESLVRKAALHGAFVLGQALFEEGTKDNLKPNVHNFYDLAALMDEFDITWTEVYVGAKVKADYQTFITVLTTSLVNVLNDYPSEILKAHKFTPVLPNDIKKWAEGLLAKSLVPEAVAVQRGIVNRMTVLAYTRLADKLVRDLRAGKYEYPETREAVTQVRSYLQEAGLAPRDVGICDKELDDLIKANPVAKTKPNC